MKKLLMFLMLIFLAASAMPQDVVFDRGAFRHRRANFRRDIAKLLLTSGKNLEELRLLTDVNGYIRSSRTFAAVLDNQRKINSRVSDLLKMSDSGRLPRSTEGMTDEISRSLSTGSMLIDLLGRSLTGQTRMNDGDRLGILIKIKAEQMKILESLDRQYGAVSFKYGYVRAIDGILGSGASAKRMSNPKNRKP